jgi:hypothetical protein
MKRPPRQIWLAVPNDFNAAAGEVFLTKKAAAKWVGVYGNAWTVTGPFVLAERVRQK